MDFHPSEWARLLVILLQSIAIFADTLVSTALFCSVVSKYTKTRSNQRPSIMIVRMYVIEMYTHLRILPYICSFDTGHRTTHNDCDMFAPNH
jgi:hypothetical protein